MLAEKAQRSLLVIAVFALVPTLASAQSPPSIQVQVDRDPVSVGEAFSITIQVEAKGSGDPDIRLPALAGLRVLSRSESHPMSMSFSFGLGSGGTRSVTRRSIYELVAVADKPGNFRIDPVVVTVDNRQYKSPAKTIRVVGSGSAVPSSPDQGDRAVDATPVQPGDLTAEDLRGATVDPDYFVQTHLSKTSAVVGERLVLTVYVFFSHNISGVDLVREPGTEGLWVENLQPTGMRREVEQVTIGGVGYARAIQRRIAVFPVEPGKLTIAAPVAEYTVQRGFFSEPKTIRRSGTPLTLEVSPLPKEGQPKGFFPVNVGRFSFEASIDREVVKVGEPVTVSMVVKGEGNIRNVALPTLSEVTGFKSYNPEFEAEVQIEGDKVQGSRTSKTLLIAKEPGQFTIPSLSFSTYDPQSGKYDTITVPERLVTVTEGAPASGTLATSASSQAGSPQEPMGQTGLERLNRQLRSIVSSADFSAAPPGSAPRSPWFLIAALGAPLGWSGFLVFGLMRRRRAMGWMRDRSKRADSEALRRLVDLRHRSPNVDSAAFHSELARILHRFLEDRLEEPVSGDTLPELRERLCRRGFESQLAEQVIAEMESLDFARFARAADGSTERQTSLDRVRKLLTELATVRVQPKGGRR
ncbi:MAG: BatD family protein [Myxococcota bacterium]|jgi:hypothetical protein|nr:BatD family protein [Myxococcota bacterium]